MRALIQTLAVLSVAIGILSLLGIYNLGNQIPNLSTIETDGTYNKLAYPEISTKMNWYFYGAHTGFLGLLISYIIFTHFKNTRGILLLTLGALSATYLVVLSLIFISHYVA